MTSAKKMTYAKSGVDLEQERKTIEAITSAIPFQPKGFGSPLPIEGHYAGAIDFGKWALVMCTDGVGSKVMVANELRKWDTIGIDCVAMNVNDAICLGAKPIALVDYFASETSDPLIAKEIGKGLAKGAKQAGISIIGGETATLPDIVKGFDLAGACLAYAKKDQLVTGKAISPGDVLVGLPSIGLHSNGYTLVRKLLKVNKLDYRDLVPFVKGKTLGEVLLTPTKIYVKEILKLIKKVQVKGLAHITGGGLENLKRLNEGVKYVLDNLFDPLPIFNFIQGIGNVSDKEMYRTFNMGMGFIVILSKENLEEALKILNRSIKAKVVGEVEKGKGVSLPTLKIKY
jgi:phosphoribosylformylglycinamidine cyclo-ligase